MTSYLGIWTNVPFVVDPNTAAGSPYFPLDLNRSLLREKYSQEHLTDSLPSRSFGFRTERTSGRKGQVFYPRLS